MQDIKGCRLTGVYRVHQLILVQFKLGFPRDGTSRCPFVPGQGHFPCPGVPLSRDKGKSKCPGTNSSVPGRPGTKLFIFPHKLHFFFPIFLCCCYFFSLPVCLSSSSKTVLAKGLRPLYFIYQDIKTTILVAARNEDHVHQHY